MGIRRKGRAALDTLTGNRPLAVCLGGIAVMISVGAGYLVAGITGGSLQEKDTAAVWLFYAMTLLVPGVVGWKLKGRQRRLAVERKLDMVMGSVGRVEDLLGGERRGHLTVVRGEQDMQP